MEAKGATPVPAAIQVAGRFAAHGPRDGALAAYRARYAEAAARNG